MKKKNLYLRANRIKNKNQHLDVLMDFYVDEIVLYNAYKELYCNFKLFLDQLASNELIEEITDFKFINGEIYLYHRLGEFHIKNKYGDIRFIPLNNKFIAIFYNLKNINKNPVCRDKIIFTDTKYWKIPFSILELKVI